MNLEKYMLPCLSKTLFGVECLGCGFQRAFLLLFQGEFIASFKMYPAIFTTLIFLFSWGLTFIFKGIFSQKTILILAFINVVFMILGYAYRHY
ncbi:hypothetical protein HNQ02_003428 [Flavobacterium sp. 7E]|uniref:DUF2752 domain-containing protein n=1 Tax=unclassified Flavobacterium TaxID=196869 RepID=UPI0015709B5C|nr:MULTISPECIES: DUF2752 domain-containing protein [unclassified Flavobacterium]MBE0391198.1 hypothetical protein [Flavobacterium sp. PL002]NRS90484.1 hypothetical protein [Flavobacterium sp. 7E]NRT16735.1 hypothetical protein [Flavobacterium sp. 28A]